MHDTDSNRRRARRVPQEELRPALHEVIVELEGHPPVPGTVVDISTTGVGLVVPIDSKTISHFQVTFSTMDRKHSITDDLVYLQTLEGHEARISIQFTSIQNRETAAMIIQQYRKPN
jgi:hypothetical protein